MGGAHSFVQPTPPISLMPSELSDDYNDVANGKFEEEQAGGQADSLDDASNAGYVSSGVPEHDAGYNTWDDMSELEDEELRGSLGQQKALEVEQNKKKSRNALEILMQDGTAKKWEKSESNRHLGYGSKGSKRTQRRKRQQQREAEAENAKMRNS